MGRADIPAEERAPFYLYVDEFQNFATDSFATILSEARKYGLYLTVANQYIAQMMTTVKDAVFGNVGSIISFRMSADDASTMTRYFEPQFMPTDLVHMNNRHFVISMTIGGEKTQAFSAISLNLPEYGDDYVQAIIDHSRSRYSSTLAYVQNYVQERYLGSGAQPAAPQQKKAAVRPAQPMAKVTPEAIIAVPQQPTSLPVAQQSTPAKAAQPQAASPDAEPAKKKRKRTRKRKKSSGVEAAITQDMRLFEDDKTIKL